MSTVKGDLGMRLDPKLLGDKEERISDEETVGDGGGLQREGWTDSNCQAGSFSRERKWIYPAATASS